MTWRRRATASIVVVVAACATTGSRPLYQATLAGVPWWTDRVHGVYCYDCEDTPMVYVTLGDLADQPTVHFEIDAVRCFSGAAWVEDLSRPSSVRVTFRPLHGEPTRAVFGFVQMLECTKYAVTLRFKAVFDDQLGWVAGEIRTAVD